MMPRRRARHRLLACVACVVGAVTLARVVSSARGARDARDDASTSTSSFTTTSMKSSFDAMMATTYARGVEYDGALIASASTVGARDSLEACGRACETTRGCNVFVWSKRGDGACWLKRRDDASGTPRRMSEGEHCAWDSGMIVGKDLPRDAGEVLARSRTRDAREVTMSLDGFGDVRLTLKPEWHASSVEYLRALASESETSCEETCEVYRVERGFLVQGTLRSFSTKANAETKPGPKLMERGDVGWAGEGPGPDFFVYLGEQPARHFGRAHTVFAVVADEASMAVLERVVAAPSSTPGGPGTMRFIDRRPRVRVSAS